MFLCRAGVPPADASDEIATQSATYRVQAVKVGPPNRAAKVAAC
jgi:hypothetical protein